MPKFAVDRQAFLERLIDRRSWNQELAMSLALKVHCLGDNPTPGSPATYIVDSWVLCNIAIV